MWAIDHRTFAKVPKVNEGALVLAGQGKSFIGFFGRGGKRSSCDEARKKSGRLGKSDIYYSWLIGFFMKTYVRIFENNFPRLLLADSEHMG